MPATTVQTTTNLTPSRRVWQLAWPLILTSISVPLLGLVDTAILGHLDRPDYLAAVALGTSLLAFFYWGFGFLRMGTTGLTAQAWGAGKAAQCQLVGQQSLLLGLALGLLAIAASTVLLPWGLQVMQAPPGLQPLSLEYMQIRIFSAPAVLMNYAIIGWFIGRQQTRLPLLITVVTNSLNIVLDLWLIIGLGLNSAGAAIATLIAEYCGLILALLLMWRQQRLSGITADWLALGKLSAYRQLLKVNRHLFFRTIALLACFAFFTSRGAGFGETTLAANQILLQLLFAVSFGLDGFAHAAEASVGDSIGARRRADFYAYCRACLYWSIAVAIGYSLFYALAQQGLLSLLTSLVPVQTEANRYFGWIILLPLLAVWSYLLDGIFIGATQTRAMLVSMLISALLVYLPVWWFSRDWGNHGLWLAFSLFHLSRGVTLALWFLHYSQQQRWFEHVE